MKRWRVVESLTRTTDGMMKMDGKTIERVSESIELNMRNIRELKKV